MYTNSGPGPWVPGPGSSGPRSLGSLSKASLRDVVSGILLHVYIASYCRFEFAPVITYFASALTLLAKAYGLSVVFVCSSSLHYFRFAVWL